MTKDEALRLALEALEYMDVTAERYVDKQIPKKAITVIKEALVQPEQPKVRTGDCLLVGVCASEGHKIQPQRTWVGLTDEEIKRIGKLDLDSNYFGLWYDFAKALEAKLKEKNT